MSSKTFYTGRGDDGYTDLLGARVPKHHPTTEFIGTLDEATSQIGMARALAGSARTREALIALQRDLYSMMAELAFVSQDLAEKYRIASGHLERLEETTNRFTNDVEIAREFILPGDTLPGAALDVARVVVRRAERVGTQLAHDGQLHNGMIVAYLNRASSLLFVLARFEDQQAGIDATTAKPKR
jgi:cob(I)alamin adenosyltransferase